MSAVIPFIHLHCHTQFSLLDGAASIKEMMKKAKNDGMKALALTDHGNMFGAFKFVAEANAQGLKPIVGCEFYLVKDRFQKNFKKGEKDKRYHQLLLAKNAEGYKNLSKLCSLGFIEGYYAKYPRIDKELILKYHQGLIATSCCLGAEIPQAIMYEGEEKAEELLQWWIDVFGEDYYIELQRHHIENVNGNGMSQEDVNQVLLRFAKKYNLKVIATNDSHYVDEKDAAAHDILLCINTGAKVSDPKATDEESSKGRFAFPNNEFYFKTQAEMNRLFADVPTALDFTNEIYDKVENLKLKRDILMPNYPLPQGFPSQFEYLRYLTFEGAKRKYGSLSAEIEQRLNYELEVMQKMGFEGYFLIVQDFINAARELGVWVGTGRGSAAGSAVAYCIGITNIDPIQYNLLFERFLNPERVSMPDIDTDFDDEGRQKVIDYVVEKYGRNQVASIITYGTMAAKMAIKDVGRVLELPLNETNELAKLISEKPGTKLKDEYEKPEIKAILEENSLRSRVLKEALVLEGSVRNRGVHAAGIIIAPDDITNYIPVCTDPETPLLITQFDGKVIEEAGMLKMDFLGLKTLTILRDAIDLIQKNHDIKIDIDKIPLDDKKTFELYQRGDTIGTFQFESEGMQTWLRKLKPTNIEDLIAMNALYRPGPMDFIPVYINRKYGREPVEYPHPLLEPILKHTYGIMVYQEQIMQTAQIIAGYTLGGADLLRRAMGKKDKEKMAKERDKFVKGAKELNNIDEKKANEIFDIMERFAEYGFNRSHSAAYSLIAFQTAYLKAHYPAEYMASVLTHSMGNIEKITFFLEECKKQAVEVLGPDINESADKFSVNKKGQIRFGLAAIKGAGEVAVANIIEERQKNGDFKSIFDFVERVNLQAVNKRALESLAQAGCFDCFKEIPREAYFAKEKEEEPTFIEKLIRYGNAIQAEKSNARQSLFGGGTSQLIPPPKIPKNFTAWSNLERLKKEKEVVGFYISGHPLNAYKLELNKFTSRLKDIFKPKSEENPEPLNKDKEIAIAGIVTEVQTKQAKNGNYFTTFKIEDYDGSLQISLFGSDYAKFSPFVKQDALLFIRGKIQKRYNSEEFEFRVQSIDFLTDAREKLIKNLILQVDLQHLSERLATELETILQENKGKIPLKMILWDSQENIQVQTFSQKYAISIDNELLESLERLEGVSVSLS
ncbi:DNA polymerase III subunit alpha [Raineya orbicola]|uniref:DNA polymerase III subunit alpha n=1 Tax=Raineya orbicola TaxID=2016530 RepID=A0A2N3I6X4_9BACT|nr:DNA polymerase III subunit alpha [Raineya orbicola]PKQ66037.1 polc: DNA polymerase III, alpha subunit [Raineya orbicola]